MRFNFENCYKQSLTQRCNPKEERWLPNWIPEDDSDARIVYFRKEMMVDDALPAKKEIKITADSRYKLYINEKFVQEGYRSPWIRKNGLLILPMLRPTLCRGKRCDG